MKFIQAAHRKSIGILPVCITLVMILAGRATANSYIYSYPDTGVLSGMTGNDPGPGNLPGMRTMLRSRDFNERLSVYLLLLADLDLTSHNSAINLYQATNSITFEPGFETQTGDEFVAEIFAGQVPLPSGSTESANSDINWIKSKSFDENGNVIAENKQFFDNTGQLLQTQSKVKYRKDASTTYTHVFATQPITDVYGRAVVSTLPAPIDNSEFSYKSDFVQSSAGGVYSYKNFDRYNPNGTETDKSNNPDPVGNQSIKGTLGWYYSSNNDWEPYTPTTDYPYSRETIYRDGTGNVKKTGGAGETFKMGAGHETGSYMTPVSNELAHYVQVRNKYFSVSEVGALPALLQDQALQMVSRDASGREIVIIQDKGGKTLMTARPGTDLTASNTINIGADGFYYFKLLSSGTVTMSVNTFTLYDMETEQAVGFSSGNTLPAGYYKLVNTGTVSLNLAYSNGYTDISYLFYNQLGQLVASVAPEGVKKLVQNINAYATRADIPFVSTYEYNEQGRLVKKADADNGIGEMVYRKDGKIRFSQNAEQKTRTLPAGYGQPFSYTNYDPYGRIIESGEYQPDASGIMFTNDLSTGSNMKNILENTDATGGLTSGVKKDAVITKYDIPDISHNQSLYVQDPATLGGAISMTKKYSNIVNNVPSGGNLVSATWYNYDSEGKLLWEIRMLPNLNGGTPLYFATDYTYDNLNRLVKKVFQKNSSVSETFIHYYEYDPVTENLWKVYTNTIDNVATKKLQATYIYYLHGPLKRIELAGNLQGIDYTYTVQGALKAINNSNKNADPGGDGSNGFATDAYGMVLDRYAGDYVNNRNGIQPIKSVDASAIVPADIYTGKVKAMTWYSEKPALSGASNAPTTYVYQYDSKYQFTESSWGNGVDFNATPASFTNTAFNKETIKDPVSGMPAYDANGNIKYLQRTDAAGALADKFTYSYLNTGTGMGSTTDYNTNRLQGITDNKSGSSVPYADYTYDACGQLVLENTGISANKKYIKYDVTGKVVAIARDAGFTNLVAEFVYNEMGQRVIKKSYNSSYQLLLVTYYAEDVIYTQQVTGGTTYGSVLPQEYALDGGSGRRMGIYFNQLGIYAYELTDHLGSVRAIIAQNSSGYDVRMYSDYYPYGARIQPSYYSAEGYRYDYQGKYAERDEETGWNAFDLRMYDSRIGRWLQTDPDGQFFSPYIGMGNDPVNGIDPDGGFTKFGAWWRRALALVNGEDPEEIYFNGREWGYNTIEGSAIISHFETATSKWWKTAEFTFDVQAKATVGFQVGAKSTFGPVSLKGEAGVYTSDIGSIKLDFAKNFKVTTSSDGDHRMHYFAALEASAPVKLKSKQLDIGLGAKIDYSYLYMNGYDSGPTMVDGTGYTDWGANIIFKKFGPKAKMIDNLIEAQTKASLSAQNKEEKTFYGLDLGTSLKVILGVEVKLRIGVSR